MFIFYIIKKQKFHHFTIEKFWSINFVQKLKKKLKKFDVQKIVKTFVFYFICYFWEGWINARNPNFKCHEIAYFPLI